MNAKLKNGCIVLTSETPAEFFDLREWAERVPVEDYKQHPFKKDYLDNQTTLKIVIKKP